jgi:hypothetical protein
MPNFTNILEEKSLTDILKLQKKNKMKILKISWKNLSLKIKTLNKEQIHH